jgi:predicted MFS family arabinose efflux permease
MNKAVSEQPADKWFVYGAACVTFFFTNFATFISLGIVLRPMIGDLHWSFTQAGSNFSVLGLAVGLTSPFPIIMMRRFGGRLTLTAGAVLLALGFFLASRAYDLPSFYLGMVFVGVGFTFTGNVPGVYLISIWFKDGAARLIGYYLMVGALGQAFGPSIVEAIVRTEGWRGHWRAMAIVAALTVVLCTAFIRNPRTAPEAADGTGGPVAQAGGWTVAQVATTYQFWLLAFATAFTMTGITTLESLAVTHLAKLGAAPHAAALLLGVVAFTAAAVKGATGRIAEKIPAARLVALGLALQAAGDVLFIFAGTTPFQIAGSLSFGIGWGLCIVAGTVGVLDYFGGLVGSRAMGIVSLLITIGVLGPVAAGAVRDAYGTYTPIFVGSVAILLVLAIPIFAMPRPKLRQSNPPIPADLTVEAV